MHPEDVDQNKVASTSSTRVGVAVPRKDAADSVNAASFLQVDSQLVPLAARWSPVLVSGGSISSDACGCDAGVAFQALTGMGRPAYLAIGDSLSGTCVASSPLPVFRRGAAFDVVVDGTTQAQVLKQLEKEKARGGQPIPTCPVCEAHKREVATVAANLEKEKEAAKRKTEEEAVRTHARTTHELCTLSFFVVAVVVVVVVESQ